MRAVLAIVAFATGGCIFGPRFTAGEDGRQWLPPTALPGLLRPYRGEDPGLDLIPAFFQGRLWVASNIGLLEFGEGRLTGLHRWTGDNTTIAFALAGADGLWVQPLQPYSLVRYDGTRWQNIQIPMPPMSQYQIRGLLDYFRVASDGARLWLTGFHHVWEWDNAASNWRTIRVSELGQRIFAVPVRDGGLFVIRNQSLGDDWIVHPDSVVNTKGEALSIRAAPFLATDAVAIAGSAWILTSAGHVLRATSTAVEDTGAPGFADAIGASAKGPPLSLVRNQGVYAFDGTWRRRIGWPPNLKIREFSFPRVTEDRGTIAVTANGHLWISRAGSPFESVPLAR
jgi:hypothetical protein